MKRKCLAVGIILLFIEIACMPGITANINDTSERFEKSDRDIYFFLFAFVSGEYENCWRQIGFFKIWNSNYSIHSINVLGYSDYQGKFISVKAYEVIGSYRIGFIGQHHCCIFAWSWRGVTVSGDSSIL
ncbi:MAG TPA: hypothetical protein VMY59_00925 [Candidatus Thermoplasmatota archaeon]|nr:hypothetical protein [Candidatus Thermoplasmatota archaeon]